MKAILQTIDLIRLPVDITERITITAPIIINDLTNINITGISITDHITGTTEDHTTIIGHTMSAIIIDNLIDIITGVIGENRILDTDTKGDN